MNAIFKGSTMDCVAHLRDAIREDKDFFEKRQVIATFTGVSDSSVHRWFSAGGKPIGEVLIRLQFYLELLGYDVKELHTLKPIVRDTARLCAYRVISLDEIASNAGYTGGDNGRTVVLSIFRGVEGISKEKLGHFATMVELYQDQLSEKKRSVQKIQIGVQPAGAPLVPERLPTVSLMRLPTRESLSVNDAVIQSLAGSVKAILPLAEELNSDRFSPEDRAKLRELAGGDGVFRLANVLYRLCGERSRTMRTKQ